MLGKKDSVRVEISKNTIVFTVFFLIGLWLIFHISGILILIFITFILMTALNPTVNAMQKAKVPRGLAIAIVFIILISIISMIIAGIVPILVTQLGVLLETLRSNFPDYQLFDLLELDQSNIAAEVAKQIETINKNLNNIFKVISSTAHGVLILVTTMVLTIYLLAERPKLEKDLQGIFHDAKKEDKVKQMIEAVERVLGDWIRGQILIMIAVGSLTYLGLIMLGIPFALPLAIIAGILEIIPNLGPTLSAIPGILAGLTISMPVAIGTLILYIAVQQLENHLITPLIMKRSTGIKPIITIVVLMIGARLGGIGGVILAIPSYLTIKEIFWQYKKLWG